MMAAILLGGAKKLSDFDALTATLLEFRDARDWRQFHSLRNLITSLNLEALRDECADILLYLLLIANTAGINLAEAARAKLVKNAQKYPVEKSFGSRAKYTELG